MLNGKRIIVVLPAYNAAQTLETTVSELDRQVVDDVLLVDDFSADETVRMARQIGIRCFLHDRNYGYGRNQKTCYTEALKLGADVVVMLHPDYQYAPKLAPAMAAMVVSGEYDVVLGSRILGGKARKSGMPLYKYIANRILTLTENLFLGSKLSEFHTGYRAFSRKVLEDLPYHENSDDFLFDNEMLAQAIFFNLNVGEISCPTRVLPRGIFHQFQAIRCIRARGSVDLRALPAPKMGARSFSDIRDFQRGPPERLLLRNQVKGPRERGYTHRTCAVPVGFPPKEIPAAGTGLIPTFMAESTTMKCEKAHASRDSSVHGRASHIRGTKE